ncbi:MAG: hypothetical protein ABI812_10700, partial [Betaproteobacteria bacterium]
MIVRAVALAIAFPIGAAWAAPTFKPDSLLAVDMNRSAIIDGVVANWQSNMTGLQEKVLRETLAKMRADGLMAASLAPSFDGLLAVMKTSQSHVATGKVTEKALATELVYNPLTPCRIVDTRQVG